MGQVQWAKSDGVKPDAARSLTPTDFAGKGERAFAGADAH